MVGAVVVRTSIRVSEGFPVELLRVLYAPIPSL